MKPSSVELPSVVRMSGTPAPVWTDLELPDVGEAQDDEAHAQGHDQRVDPEDADADAVDEAGQRGDDERRPGSPGAPRPGCGRASR